MCVLLRCHLSEHESWQLAGMCCKSQEVARSKMGEKGGKRLGARKREFHVYVRSYRDSRCDLRFMRKRSRARSSLETATLITLSLDL